MRMLSLIPAAELDPRLIAMVVGGALLMQFFFALVFVRNYRRAKPHQALVITGRHHPVTDSRGRTAIEGSRIVKGGGTFVWPVLEEALVLSLEVAGVDLRLPSQPSGDGRRVTLEGTLQVRIPPEDEAIRRAARHFPGAPAAQIALAALRVVEIQLQAAVGRSTPEAMRQDLVRLAQDAAAASSAALADLGLQVVSLSIRSVADA